MENKKRQVKKKKEKARSTSPNSDQNTNENQQLLLNDLNDKNTNKIPKEVNRIIDGVKVTISEASMKCETSLCLKIDGKLYSYTRTKAEYNGVTYFQCVNRKKGLKTGKKWLAKAHFHSSTKSIEVIDLHNINCQTEEPKAVLVNYDYQSQEDDIINNLAECNKLTVVGALDMLRDKNAEASPASKRVPLKYEQVKNILKIFRKENLVNSEGSFSDPTLQRTVEGALFRRCHNQYNIIYKSKFFI